MSEPTIPSNDGERIVISNADLNSADVEQRVQAMAEAQKVALVREVGAPSKGASSWRAILTLTAGGAIGGAVAFLAIRILFNGLHLFEDNVFLNNMTFTFMLALFIGIGVSLADVVTNRSWSKVWAVAAVALPAAVVAALVMGFLAHLAYSSGTEWLLNNAFDQYQNGMSEDEVTSYVQLRLHPIRGFAWMLVGISAGIAAGAASRSWKRLALAAIGGAVGGFLGGFIFDFIPMGDTEDSANQAEFIAQLVGIVLLGTLIGLAMGLIEQAGKSRWIEIVSGGLAGKQFILYKPTISLGSAPTADITLIKDSSIPGIAAVMRPRGNRLQIDTVEVSYPVIVNGSAVTSTLLADGDIVTFGSTQLRFREKGSQDKVPGALRS